MEVNTNRTRELQFMVSTLSGHPDLGLLRAAARSGALAILNLEAVSDIEGVLATFVRARVGRIGIRVDSSDVLQRITGDLLDPIDVVVCTRQASAVAGVLARLRSDRRKIFLECTTLEDARAGAELKVDALIAKGHEAGGYVGEETTFVLVQRVLADTALPVWAHGGIGTHTAGACVVAGCAGVVLDSQLLLARESSAPEPVKAAVERMTGDETLCLGGELGERYRVFRRPGLDAVTELQRIEADLAADDSSESRPGRWRDAILSRIAWRVGSQAIWPLGQDAAFAADLAKQFRSVPGILGGLEQAIAADVETARDARPLDRDAPLARAHRTAFPILQGPMTRVSDTARFAAAVAEGGGLPFLALALLRAPQVRALMRETKELLGDRPWGVGILGFVPLELREEQLGVIEEFRPPFALIAGGRPDQAVHLERLGITTYLHVPAPGLLKMFIDAGARHFIFEGRECGGHVGPRTSFVLWQLTVDRLLEAIARGVPAAELQIVFAGGIHDARSAAMVSAIAAPLVKAGARFGVLLGTAYLFTEEAVTCGAIVETFQQEALKCDGTVLLESGPGHATRCAATAFAGAFRDTRRQLIADGKNGDDIRLALETLNLGRLRIASKGIRRDTEAADGDGAGYTRVETDEQQRDGMYMIGQVAALRARTCRIADLHRDVAEGSAARLCAVAGPLDRVSAGPFDRLRAGDGTAVTAAAVATKVAIVGMGCLLPKAQDVGTLWRNVLNGVDAIREVPRERFDSDLYFDPDRRARDRIYSKWGGFLDEVPFEPLKHGIPPAALPSIDPFQLLTLEVVEQALRDAGYADRPFNRERTSVILGASGGGGELGFRYGIRSGLPMYVDQVSEQTYSRLPEWTEDSFAGVLLNVAAGRVANRLDLGGLNFTVDAACASSLAAVFLAARELETGSSDMVLVGGIDTVNSPFGYLCFSSAQALSPRGRCSTFDDGADGIAISEGIVVLALKRLEDAERHGDRIYAVIRSVAGSSDGRGKGLTAPRPEGQMRVLTRAYAAAGISPATVGLIEAHGTGTVAGDTAEVTALSRVFTADGAAPHGCALGSIKSMIGHTKSAAGVSGLLKVALSLHHKVLPPTLHVKKPNATLREPDSPFYVNSEARPWIAPGDEPRRAGVSSFGFGGTNFHVVVEEYDAQPPGAVPSSAATEVWPAELAVWTAGSSQELIDALHSVEAALWSAPNVPLRAVAAAVCRGNSRPARAGDLRLAIVADSVADLGRKAAAARVALEAGRSPSSPADSIYSGVTPDVPPKIAFLFPGQGAQYPGMHRGLSLHFSDLRHALEIADRATAGGFPRRLSSYVFPPPAFTKADEESRMRELTDTSVAQPALGAMELGLLGLYDRLGVRPSFTAGHSYGEYVALLAAGVFSIDSLFTLSAARGRLMKQACGDRSSTMAVAGAAPNQLEGILPRDLEVWIANLNTPKQTVIAGTDDAIDKAIGLLAAVGIVARRIEVSCAFHSPLVEPARHEMTALLARTEIRPPRIPVFSNSLAAPYPNDPDEIREVLASHIVRPVRFVEQIENMYSAGARVFLEVGPRNILTNLVRETLARREAQVIPVNTRGNAELPQFLGTLAQLSVLGTPIDFDVLWHGRAVPVLRVSELEKAAPAAPSPHAWMVSGGEARKPNHPAPSPKITATPASVNPPPSASLRTMPAPVAGAPRQPETVSAQTRLPEPVAAVQPARTPGQPKKTDVTNEKAMHTQRIHQLPSHAGDHEVVMQQFQQLMSQFLQTQAVVMTTYLQGVSNGNGLPAASTRNELPSAPAVGVLEAPPAAAFAVALPQVATVLPAPVATGNGGHRGNGGNGAFERSHPAPVSVEAVNPVAALAPPPAPPAPVAAVPAALARTASALTESEVLTHLVRIVSDRTGYPEEMLAVDANIEADLGIDSIKRMEILAAFQEMHAGSQSGSFQQALERLTALKTLRESAVTLAEILAAPAEAAAV